MRRNHLIVPALVLVSLLQGCVMFNVHKASRENRFTTPHYADSSVMVSSRNGAIEVIADPTLDEVVIHAKLTCGGSSDAEARQRLADATLTIERDTSMMLTIEPSFPGGPRNGDGAKIIVRLPDAYGANLSTGNGHVLARGLAGALLIDTSNGRVTIEAHDGEAQVRTSNGSIRVTRHGGPLEARTSNGKITVTLNDDQEGPLNLRSSNGAIYATVGYAFAGHVDFDTPNGRVRIKGDETNIRKERIRRTSGYIVLGEGGSPESVLDTSNGSIEFTIGE